MYTFIYITVHRNIYVYFNTLHYRYKEIIRSKKKKKATKNKREKNRNIFPRFLPLVLCAAGCKSTNTGGGESGIFSQYSDQPLRVISQTNKIFRGVSRNAM